MLFGYGPDWSFFLVPVRLIAAPLFPVKVDCVLNRERYSFVNLSIGPDISVMDDDVSYWTVALDERFTGSQFIPTIAAGNSGLMDAASGLNRIQPPADAINALSVGQWTGPLARGRRPTTVLSGQEEHRGW